MRVPPPLVQKAMSTAPRSFVLGGREERFDLLLDGNSSYLATDGTGVHVIDPETREMRASCKEDVATLESALTYAKAGIPTSPMAMPTTESTAPATPLGAMVVGDAEVVSGVVLVQLANPGAPGFHSNYVSLMHRRTGGYVAHFPIPVRRRVVQMTRCTIPSRCPTLCWPSSTASWWQRSAR